MGLNQNQTKSCHGHHRPIRGTPTIGGPTDLLGSHRDKGEAPVDLLLCVMQYSRLSSVPDIEMAKPCFKIVYIYEHKGFTMFRMLLLRGTEVVEISSFHATPTGAYT